MTKRTKLVAGNWKMHGDLASNRQLAAAVAASTAAVVASENAVEIAIFPPFVHLHTVVEAVRGTPVVVGGQNLSDQAVGAFTGEVSGQMLVDCGCRWVLVGHSERRRRYGETDDLVLQKLLAAIQVGLSPVLCVGETLEERDAAQTETVIRRQLAVLETLTAAQLAPLVVAYEPVWAIGTGQTATPDQAQAIHQLIRAQLGVAGDAMRIVYGGSVTEHNAAELFAMPDIDGGLVGGASLRPLAFAAIANAAFSHRVTP